MQPALEVAQVADGCAGLFTVLDEGVNGLLHRDGWQVQPVAPGVVSGSVENGPPPEDGVRLGVLTGGDLGGNAGRPQRLDHCLQAGAVRSGEPGRLDIAVDERRCHPLSLGLRGLERPERGTLLPPGGIGPSEGEPSRNLLLRLG
ncbi:MAG: hypothetical protein HS113_09060 [Verrucomicrobiales bacterium]|nr:hypothetical protein [Verrucomicrobiales bacterium]